MKKNMSLISKVAIALNLLGTAMIVLMAVLVNADILSRNFLNAPIGGVIEFISLSIVSIVFLQIPNTIMERRHISNDILINLLKNSIVRNYLSLLYSLLGVILMILIFINVLPNFVQEYRGNFFRGTAGFIEIPTWPFMLLVLVGSFFAILQYLVEALQAFKSADDMEKVA